MNIGSICSRRLVTIGASGSLTQAAQLMHEHHVGALIVTTQTEQGTEVDGIVTDRDLVIDVLAHGLAGDELSIGDLAHARLVSVPESASVADAIEAMQEGRVRRVLVRNGEGMLVGIVSLDDLMDACAAELTGLARAVRRGIEREAAAGGGEGEPKPAALRIPSIGTAGWNRVLS